MGNEAKASLAFPVTCILISFAVTSYIYRAWFFRQSRACKHLVQQFSRRTTQQTRRGLHRIAHSWPTGNARGEYDIIEPSFRTDANRTELRAHSGNDLCLWDLDTNSDAASTTSMDIPLSDCDSNASTSSEESRLSQSPPRPVWIIDSTGGTVLNHAHEPLPRAQWERDLEKRIRNGRGPGAWLDKVIDWTARCIVADFDAEVREDLERSGIEYRGPSDGLVQI